MRPLYTQIEFDKAKTKDKLPCECYECQKTFYTEKQLILSHLNGKNKTNQIKFCNLQCKGKNIITRQEVNCAHCNKTFTKLANQIKRYPNHFCSRSCAAIFNNTHKKHGTRRSKIEIYFEKCLIELYPDISFDFNKKDTINSELDIYIPSMKLAFELNGIYHYEPIHGINKLNQVQNNDQRKFQACLEKGIELVLIDISSMNYFKKEKASMFLNIITTIINKKIKREDDGTRTHDLQF